MADVYLQFELWHAYYSDQAYPNRYYEFSPESGSLDDSGSVTISYTLQHYSTWRNGRITAINFVEVWFYDAAGNYLSHENASGYASSTFNGASGKTTIDLSKCTNSEKKNAARMDVLIETNATITTPGGDNWRETPVGNSSGNVPSFTLVHYSKVSAPTNPKFASTLSRSTVRFSWGAGSDGNGGNNVEGYQVQYQFRAPEAEWPTTWTDIPSSPVTTTEIWADPPQKVGYYRRSRVRTLGSAGEGWHSDWVITTNTLQRKWDAFPEWTDPTLVEKSSHIRAVHLTEMQERINVIRAFFGKSAYSFTTVKAGETKIAKWAALIGEMRAALDDLAGTASNWNTLEAGKPRIAHITQLRSVIDNW